MDSFHFTLSFEFFFKFVLNLQVQEAVANCIPALIPAVAGESKKIVEGLITKVMESEKYGERYVKKYGFFFRKCNYEICNYVYVEGVQHTVLLE